MVYTTTSAAAEGQGGSARELAEYAEPDQSQDSDQSQGTALKDSTGREMDEGQKDHFVYQAEQDGFRRSVVFSTDPENQISETELDEKTRSVMDDFTENRPSTDYVYGIHNDTDKIHSHVVVRGEKRDLWLSDDGLSELKVNAQQQFQGRGKAQDLATELDYDAADLSLADDQSEDLTPDLDTTAEAEWVQDATAEVNLDHDRDLGRGMGP